MSGLPGQDELRDFRAKRDIRDTPSMPPAKKPRSRRVRHKPGGRPDPGPPPAPMPGEGSPGAEAAAGSALRRLATPRPVPVVTGDRGVPARVGPLLVEVLLEEWVVEDRWWTGQPLRRRYFELVLVNGRNVVVFRDLVDGGWFSQRA